MRVALILYGDLDFISGGFLYDRMLVEYLRRRGDQVDIVSLPWRPYAGGLLDNLSPGLMRRLASLRADVIVQDELAHPSLLRLNRRLKQRGGPPRWPSSITCAAPRRGRPEQNRFYRRVERGYLASVDAFIFNSRVTQKTVEVLVGQGKPSVVAYPRADRFASIPPRQPWPPRPGKPPPAPPVSGELLPGKACTPSSWPWPSSPGRPRQLTVVGSLDIDPPYVQEIRRRMTMPGSAPSCLYPDAPPGRTHPYPGQEPRPGSALLL